MQSTKRLCVEKTQKTTKIVKELSIEGCILVPSF